MSSITDNNNINSNNKNSEKKTVINVNNSNILTPPLSPLSTGQVVDDNQKLTEVEVEAKQTEIKQPLSEELVEKLEDNKSIAALKINFNLESPMNTVEKIIISPPTANDISEEEASIPNIDNKELNQENEEIINQDLLTVSPILGEAKLPSNSGSLNISQLKENPNILKSLSIKSDCTNENFRNNLESPSLSQSIIKSVSIKSGSTGGNTKNNQHPPPLPRKDLIYNRRSYIEPLYYTKYMDRSRIGQSLILNEGACNTTFRSASPILYTAEPQDTTSVAEAAQYEQSEIIEPYNQSFYMMSPSCANIDLDCLNDVKDSKKGMSLRLRHSTSSINKQIKKLKKPFSKVFLTSNSRENTTFSLDASEDEKINNTISHLTAQYESLDQFMLDTEQKMKKYNIALSPSELTIQYTVLELMENIYQRISYVRIIQNRARQIRESACRIKELELIDQLNQLKKHGLQVSKDIDNQCGKITDLLNQAEVLYYKIWKRVFRQWIECRMLLCEKECNQVKEKYTEVEKSIPDQIKESNKAINRTITSQETSILSKLEDLKKDMDDKENQYKDEYIKSNESLERSYQMNINNIKEEVDSKDKILQDILKERIDEVVGKLCEINEELQEKLESQRQNYDNEIEKIRQQHEEFRTNIEKRFNEQNNTFENEIDTLKNECINLENNFNERLQNQENKLQNEFNQKIQDKDYHLTNAFVKKLQNQEIK